jgi:alkylhydroperoxidase family enzyme
VAEAHCQQSVVTVDEAAGVDPAMRSGAEALRRVAPDVGTALTAIEAAAWGELDQTGQRHLGVLISRACAEVHGLVPLDPPGATPTPGGSDAGGHADVDRIVVDFATQCSVDVASVTDDQRRTLFAGLGDRAATVVATIFVMDFLPRTRSALDALFRPSDPGAWAEGSAADGARAGHGQGPADDGLWGALDRFVREVPRLGALDPITTELVRLRGARQHRCRLCQSLRSRPALVAGADEAMFAAVDAHDGDASTLSDVRRAALALTDAMIWTPGRIERGAVEAVRVQLSNAQQVELVLDVTRNALNKVAVALAADAAHVDDGIEIYDIDEAGDLVYGLVLD